ncbi:MAG: uroporphyrinogen-III synthase [Persicimonas sp.]
MSRTETTASNKSVCVVYTGISEPDTHHPLLEIEHLPMLQVGPVDFDAEKVRALTRQPCTLVFYSKNSARIVAEHGLFEGIDLSNHTVWAVGQKTAAAVEAHLDVSARVPERERFEGLVDQLNSGDHARPIVAFSLQGSPRELPRALDDREDVFEIPVYRTFPRPYPALVERLADLSPDWIAFTSPRGVDTFISQAEGFDLSAVALAAIGPTTAGALRDHGLSPAIVLDTPDRERMMERIKERAARSQAARS